MVELQASPTSVCPPRNLIVLGGSLGGILVLETLLESLSREAFSGSGGTAMVAVLHRGTSTQTSLSELLQMHCSIPVREPNDKEKLSANTVYIAPADYHLLIEYGDGCPQFALTTEQPVHYARPSIDLLFESGANCFRKHCLALILTGNNTDGAEGAACVVDSGGALWVQDPEEAEAPVMPRGAIEACLGAEILALADIVHRLAHLNSLFR